MERTICFLLLFFLLGCTTGEKQGATKNESSLQVLYVKKDASGQGDGSSWSDAYNRLQNALDEAESGMEIWVAVGTYYPSSKVNGEEERHKTFQLKTGVALYGGFIGNESKREDRNWEAHETILSGDLKGNDDGFDNNAENSFHVLTGSGTDRTALLDGFVVTGGNANLKEWPDDGGGGMTNYGGSPTIRNCTFRGNAAFADGGGIRNWAESKPLISNCNFISNKAEQEGGGVMSGIDSEPTIQYCLFQGNSAGEDGGGMYSNMHTDSRVFSCVFRENKAGLTGAGMYNVNESSSQVINCTFFGNEAAEAGGAISNKDSNPMVTNCILWGNRALMDPEVFNDASNPTIRFSLVAGGYPGTGNIGEEPKFTDADRRLSPDSPGIDAGDSSVLAPGMDLDMDHKPRVAGARVDLGAYETRSEASNN